MKQYFEQTRRWGDHAKNLNELKVVFIGEKGIGKTSLIRNYQRGYKLNPNQQATREHDKIKDEIFLGDRTFDLLMIDMAGGYKEYRLEEFELA